MTLTVFVDGCTGGRVSSSCFPHSINFMRTSNCSYWQEIGATWASEGFNGPIEFNAAATAALLVLLNALAAVKAEEFSGASSRLCNHLSSSFLLTIRPMSPGNETSKS